MLSFFDENKTENAISILKNDHIKVKDLFKEFENTDDLPTKKKIAAEAIMELKIHAEIEEKIFYPSVRRGVEKDLMNEADEEHHVAKLLIAELENIDPKDDHWEAKFTVLAENIRHHIKEEEGEMLPQARRLDVDFHAIGLKLLAKKQELKKNGVPPSDEDKLMAKRGAAKADSPAKAAKKAATAGSKKKTAAARNHAPATYSRKVAGKRG